MYANAEREYLEKVVKKKVGEIFVMVKMSVLPAVQEK